MAQFTTQGYLNLVLDTQIDLSGAINPKIRWEDPRKRTGEWDAVINGTTVSRQLTNSSINVAGVWKFQAMVTIGGLNAPGDIVEIQFDNIITP